MRALAPSRPCGPAQPPTVESAPAAPASLPAGHLARARERQFATMTRAFARHGGLVDGDEAAWLLRRYARLPISALARWVVEGRVVSFAWEGRRLVPLFQFTPCEMTLRPGIAEAARALVAHGDAWAIARWFALPNDWLDGCAPVDILESDPVAVVRAACAATPAATAPTGRPPLAVRWRPAPVARPGHATRWIR